jgi:diaminohydroxyphosphoribosylaminopyrimidine deaminase/5-amino-6-(5-phosphoribosylamino)uracil reductase
MTPGGPARSEPPADPRRAGFASLMREAIALALRGRGFVEPNPRVGALVLRDGQIVGRGYHTGFGAAHAEVDALRAATASGVLPDTLVVTLEPCSSAVGSGGKKTPPCTEAILGAGVGTVVFGQADPDPRHGGRGLARLEQRGVRVIHGVLEDECAAINRPFCRGLQLDLPWVIAKWAMTLDGKTASRSGDSRWISGDASRTLVHRLRSQVDAVMVGYRTAVQDDPELTVRHVEGADPVRIVVDPLAALPTTSKLVQTAGAVPTWCLVGPGADRARVAGLRALGVEVIELDGPGGQPRRLALADGLRALRARGIRRLLLEGGGKLTAELMAAECVHQVMAFIAPKVVGGDTAATPVGGVGCASIAQAWRFGEVCCEQVGDDVVVHAFVT